MSSEQQIQYVIVQEDGQDSATGMAGIQREELEGAIEALTQQAGLLRQADGKTGLSGAGGPQQFQIVKEDGEGRTTTTTIVLVDESTAAGEGSFDLQQLKTNSSEQQAVSSHSGQLAHQDVVSIVPDRSGNAMLFGK